MSVDVSIWGKKRPAIRALLSASDWKKGGRDGWVIERPTWLIRVGVPALNEPDDVPAEVLHAQPGAKWEVGVVLEPIGAPKAAFQLLDEITSAIALAADGIVVHDGLDKAFRPSTGEHIDLDAPDAAPTAVDRAGNVEMAFWYLNSPLRKQEGAVALLRLLEQHAPDAVPRRFDFNRYTSKLGMAAVAKYIAETTNSFAGTDLDASAKDWYINVADAADADEDPQFRSNMFALTLPARVFSEPRREASFRALWRGVAALLRPFYGDLRQLRPDPRHGDMIEMHPVQSWFFRGIPKPGIAFLLGPPYASLWRPDGCAVDDGLTFVEHERWSALEKVKVKVPSELALPVPCRWKNEPDGGVGSFWDLRYPKVWPFDRRG